MRRPAALIATVLGSLALGAAFLSGVGAGASAGAVDTVATHAVSAGFENTPWGLMRDGLKDTPWGLMRQGLDDTPWGFFTAGPNDTPWG